MPDPRSSPTVVILAPADDARAALVQELALAPSTLRLVATLEEARQCLAESKVALLVAAIDHPDGSGFTLLAEMQQQYPNVGRMLWARYDELPRVLREGAALAIERVLARPGRASSLARTIRERLDLGDPFSDGDHTEQHGQLFAVVLRAADAFVRLHGSVVRSLPKDAPAGQLQLVVPVGDDFERARAGLRGYFGEPLKPRGAPMAADPGGQALLEVLGDLKPEQEAFFIRPSMEQSVYVAFFPWRKEAKCTVVIGVLSDADALEGDRVVRQVRERVVLEMGEFVVPRLDGQGLDKARYVPEYDWVVTEQYAGPDRREKPTGFANSFLVVGKRKALIGGLEAIGGFIDGFKPWVMVAFAAYLLLSSIDTVLTWVLISGGKVRELNPLLRPLIGHHPIAFVLVKNTLSLASFFVVARFQLFHAGKVLIGANLLLYAVLNIYWAMLIMRLLARMP